MKWQPSSPNILIGRKEKKMDVLPSIAPLPATLMGN
jgi:hypothetical protein